MRPAPLSVILTFSADGIEVVHVQARSHSQPAQHSHAYPGGCHSGAGGGVLPAFLVERSARRGAVSGRRPDRLAGRLPGPASRPDQPVRGVSGPGGGQIDRGGGPGDAGADPRQRLVRGAGDGDRVPGNHRVRVA